MKTYSGRIWTFSTKAEGISRLIGYWGVTQEEAAAKLGLAQSTLANKLRLLRLSAPVQELIRQNGLTERHGRALLKLPDEVAQLAAAKTICKKSMTVSQAEQYINTLLARQKNEKTYPTVYLQRYPTVYEHH